MIAADYFDGRSSRRHPANLGLRDGAVVVEGEFGRRSAALDAVEICTGTDRTPSTIRFADGAICEIRDSAAWAAELAGAGFGVGAVASAERHWHWALAALAGAVLIVAAIYAYALPWIAGLLAPAIPQAVTQSISDAVLKGLDARLLAPSKTSPQRQQEIAARVAALGGAGDSLPPHRLLFRASPTLGANAFALPGGDVVVLDELLALARRDEDVVAVVAHELGHLRHHHGMRQLLQSAVVSFVVGVYLGDISTVVAGLTTLLLESRYSREFELEADAYAGRLLLSTPASLDPLIDMLLRLDAAHAKSRAADRGGLFGVGDLLSSHPDTAGRVSALRAMKR
ncbi:M48 family metallopeptidase [Sulfuritalea sp.]|uniref:M48 family metallopeptidase n=1 Tax=Sulfuritalea sp. TaxID=2480090 RepID=UPI00286D7D27|nr:M48 family metallopeptidase [Sulfuritalea sp.]